MLVCDGGEIGQWPQAMLAPSRRIINGPAGSIGVVDPVRHRRARSPSRRRR